MPCDFSIEHYEQLLEKAIEAGYHLPTFSEQLAEAPTGQLLLIRHDIDVSLDPARKILEVELRLGVRTTYFLRLRASGYNLLSTDGRDFLDKVAEARAEVALHSDAGLGRSVDLVAELGREKMLMEDLVGHHIAGFSAHVPKQWQVSQLSGARKAVGLAYEAGEPVFNDRFRFCSDSNREWTPACFGEWIGEAERIYAIVHPIWWTTPAEDVAEIVESLASHR